MKIYECAVVLTSPKGTTAHRVKLPGCCEEHVRQELARQVAGQFDKFVLTMEVEEVGQ